MRGGLLESHERKIWDNQSDLSFLNALFQGERLQMSEALHSDGGSESVQLLMVQ